MQLCFDSVNLTIAHALSSKELSESLLDSFLLTVLAGVYWRKIDDIYACAFAKKNEIVHHVVPLNSLYFHVSTVVNDYYFQFPCFKPLIYEQSFCRGPTVKKNDLQRIIRSRVRVPKNLANILIMESKGPRKLGVKVPHELGEYISTRKPS